MQQTNTKTSWDLTSLFKSDDDPSIDTNIKNATTEYTKFEKKWKLRKDYLTNATALKEALDDYEKLLEKYDLTGDAGYYLQLRASLEQDNPKIKGMQNKQRDIAIANLDKIRFFEHKIAKIKKNMQKVFLEDKTLKDYKHFLKRQFDTAKYNLSEKEEKILVSKDAPSHANWVKMLREFLQTEEREVLTETKKVEKRLFSEIAPLLSNKDKAIRESAAKACTDISAKYEKVSEHELNSILQDKKINDDLRKFNRPDSARHLSDDIDTKTVDVLINAVTTRLDLSHNYYALKAKLLGVKQLSYYERNLRYGTLNKKYEFDDAISLVLKTFEKLDIEFAQIFKNYLANGQIDVYPKKGKYGGAFCISGNLAQKSYVLLNHTGLISDVTTIAHEMGHAINNEFIKKRQNALNQDTPLCIAEVASTFMEDFVLDELMLQADDELKLALMIEKLNSDISSIQRQIACYTFEQELHKEFREKGYLTKENISALFVKHMSSYLGKSIVIDELERLGWVSWPHVRSFFYVYTYASGLLISKALQNMVKQNKSKITNIKEFLSAGTSDSPKNIFLKLDIDINSQKFWNKGLDEIQNLLESTQKLAIKLGKLDN